VSIRLTEDMFPSLRTHPYKAPPPEGRTPACDVCEGRTAKDDRGMCGPCRALVASLEALRQRAPRAYKAFVRTLG
jgi:hypothetical protein